MTSLDVLRQLMAVADKLYSLSEDRVVHASSAAFQKQMDSEDWFRGKSADPEQAKFNMTYPMFVGAECGTICCVMGWGDILFPRSFDPIGPYSWIYAGGWANLVESGGDSAKAAAHRIWFWVAEDRVGFDGPDRSDGAWLAFVERWPLEECRSRAMAFLDGR